MGTTRNVGGGFKPRKTIVETKTVEGGKVIKSSKVEETLIPTEPAYFRVYLKDISLLFELQKKQRDLLDMLMVLCEPDTMKIRLPGGTKKEIAEKLNTTTSTLDNAISALVRKDILQREGTGVFRPNPFIFGKGSWSNIFEIRMEVIYNKKGKKMKTTMKYNEDKNGDNI